MKTATCQKYNSPDITRLTAYVTQVCTLTTIQFFVFPFCDQYKRDDDLLKIIKDIRDKIDALYFNIGVLFVNPDFATDKQMELVNALTNLWPSDVNFNIHRILYVIKNIVDEMIDTLSHFWQAHDSFSDQQKLWDDMSALVSTLQACISLSEEDSALANKEIKAIKSVLFPKKEQNEQNLKLYLLDNKYWVVALSRKDARMLLLNEYNIVCKHITGINQSEKMEDGRTAQDMIDMAGGEQKIIGLTEP